VALLADGDSKYGHAVGIRDKLLFACPECGYNPKVDCPCYRQYVNLTFKGL